MLTDLMCTDNYAMFNVKVANVMGLHAAVYVNEILNITQKAQQKRKIVNGYVTIDRDYVHRRTTIFPEEQISIDKKLVGIGVLSVAEDNPDNIQLSVDTLANLVAADDACLLKKVTKLTEVKSVVQSSTKMSMRQKTILELKDFIKCSNEELLNAYRDWVDGVYANPKGYLSKRAIIVFQRDVDEFARGDLDLALKIIEIATINGWRCAEWAINSFKKDYAKDFYATYTQTVPSPLQRSVSLSDEVF